MIRAIGRLISEFKWRRFMADLDVAERRARAANDNRAIGRVRKERRARVRAMIEQAAAHERLEREVRHARGWRSGWATR